MCALPPVDSYDANGKLIVCYSYALQALFAIDLGGQILWKRDQRQEVLVHEYSGKLLLVDKFLNIFAFDQEQEHRLVKKGLECMVTNLSYERKEYVIFNVLCSYQVRLDFKTLALRFETPVSNIYCQQNQWRRFVAELRGK